MKSRAIRIVRSCRLPMVIVLVLAAQFGTAGCSSGGTLAVNPGLKDDRGAARLHAALERGAAQVGLASWYGKQFHGRRTANGEIYDMDGVTAAHKTLPFGTVVRVKNLDNGKDLNVRVNDRGPFIRGRILDLSHGAAQRIGLIGPGVARVEITVVSWPSQATPRAASSKSRSPRAAEPPKEAGAQEQWVQAGAFQERRRATRLASQLKAIDARFRVYSSGGWHRVQARMASTSEANALLETLREKGIDAVLRKP